ncbi:GGTA1 galactosyltransferase, partial [Polypterus senegalus]
MANHWHKPEMLDGGPQALSASLKQHTVSDVKTSEGGIQIFAVIKWTSHEEYLCRLDCDNRVVFMDAQVKIFFSIHNFPYMLVDLHCHNPCTLATVIKVAVTTKSQNMTQSSSVQIQSFNESESPRDLTVCISAFSSYNRRQLLQHVSAYQHLGAEKIYIYQSETSVETQKMLAKFLEKGCVEVINWKVDAILRPAATDLIQALQWAAWRDCIYRNKRGSQNLILAASDQNGLFTKGYAWTGMLQVFRKENFSINDMEVRDCARYVATSDDASRQEKSTEGAQARCGDAPIMPLLRTNTTFAVLTLAAEPSTKKNLSPLAQCLGSTASQEQVTFIQLRIEEKEKTSSLVKPVRDAQALVVTAFYEDRQQKDLILITGIVKRSHYEKGQGALYCHVPCGNAIHVRPIHADIHGDHFDFPYGMASLTCTNPCGSRALTNVTVSTSSDRTSSGVTLTIHNTKDSRPPEPLWDFTVCTSTMFNNFSNVLQLIQSLEMYRLLGARKVVIYKTSCSDQVQEVLDYYVKEGFVQLLEWTVNLYLNPSASWSYKLHKGDLHYHGQIVALNDCLYRNMYSSKYLVLIDQDEIIVPYKHNNWRDLIDSLREVTPGANIFRFSNRVFPTDMYDKDPGALQWNDVPGVNVLQFVNRETKLEWFDPKKMIVDPRIAYKASVHYLTHHSGKVKEVDEWEALMFHYKEHKVISAPRNDLRLLDYKAELSVNVNQVLSQTLRRTHWNAPIIGEGTFNREVVQNHFTKENPTIGLTVFAIGKYLDAYLEKFLLTAEMYFMKGYRVIVYVIVDDPTRLPYVEFGLKHSYKVFRILKEDRWQDISMMRMKTLSDLLKKYIQYEVDYVFCMDVDQYFLAPYSVETLGDLVAQVQAWFFHENNYKFTYERRPQSTAYIADGMGDYYYHAAVFGGRPLKVLELVDFCFQNIVEDKKKNIEAIWHDESHLNKYFLLNKPTKILNPDYCWDYNIARNSNAKLAWATKDYANLRQK